MSIVPSGRLTYLKMFSIHLKKECLIWLVETWVPLPGRYDIHPLIHPSIHPSTHRSMHSCWAGIQGAQTEGRVSTPEELV